MTVKMLGLSPSSNMATMHFADHLQLTELGVHSPLSVRLNLQ